MAYHNFEDLEVWKRARQLKNELAHLVEAFPSAERFRLADQLIRSSRSIGCQLAEGHGRRTVPDRLRFCMIARGSLSETLNHLIDAYDAKYISENTLQQYRDRVNEVERLLNGYISFLEKQLPR